MFDFLMIFSLFLVIFLSIWILRLGFGNGCFYIKCFGIFNLIFNLCILFLNNVLIGLINLNFMFFGNLLILWCDLIVCVVLVFDLIMFV